MLVAKVLERGSGELLFNGYTISDLQDKKTYGVDGGDGCTRV